MKRLISLLRMTIVGGLLFLVPFVVLFIVLGKAFNIIRKIITPVVEKLPVESLIGLETPKILAVFVVIILCLLAGLFARTLLAKKIVGWLEDIFLSNLPGYSFLKNLGNEMGGTVPTEGYESVLVRFDDAWQIGFLIERIPGGKFVVFIPGAPNPLAGGVFIFSEDRVKPIGAASASTIKCLRKLGVGTGDLLNSRTF